VDRFDDISQIDGSEYFAGSASGDACFRPVAVVGMHRSGTSMVAKLLQQAGLHLGDETDLMPAADENPEGFYEHLEFVRLNDEVLNAAGAGWDCPPAAGFDWDDEALDPFRVRAQRLAAPLAERPPWGWKDPRTSLTLPFWRRAFGPLRVHLPPPPDRVFDRGWIDALADLRRAYPARLVARGATGHSLRFLLSRTQPGNRAGARFSQPRWWSGRRALEGAVDSGTASPSQDRL
jgi:hypothetical protein